MQWFYIEIVCKIVLGSKINYQNYQSLIFTSRHLLIILTLKIIDFLFSDLLGTFIKNNQTSKKVKNDNNI